MTPSTRVCALKILLSRVLAFLVLCFMRGPFFRSLPHFVLIYFLDSFL